ncbi:hypothetical protein MMC30_002588 [Trapelia coarctata]|nr:hypothetical protein [Trapelia coarctata]
MHSLSLAAVLATYLTAINAQVVYTNGTFQCLGPAADKNFCAGDSLSTNIIIRCTGTKGQPGNCNDNLAGVPPVGVKTFAPCFQTSNTTGDAACSYNGIAYPSDGRAPFNITDGTPVSSSSPTSSSTTATETASTTVTETTTATETEPASTTEAATEITTESASTTGTETASATETGSASETVTSVVVITASGTTYTTAVATGTGSTPTVTPFAGGAGKVGVVGGVVVGVVGVVVALL